MISKMQRGSLRVQQSAWISTTPISAPRTCKRPVAPAAATEPARLAGAAPSPLKAAARASRVVARAAAIQSSSSAPEQEVLAALRNIIDPDFGQDIVACGFIKALAADPAAGRVAVTIELTTPACPVKEVFKNQANDFVKAIPWVKTLDLTMTAQPPKPMGPASGRPGGLKNVAHIIAVSSCKGGVGKSTTAVNLAYTLAQMGAKVGIFDADVYGPSLPLMINPEIPILEMDPETKALKPAEYLGVKAVSFGFAGQGSAIMRGAMVSGLITQMLTTAEWGDLDYLVVDFPPGTGDIQLTLCQTVAFSAAVIVTTPQKLAFIDVAKGIKMFAKLVVPCVAVVENMSYFEADGKRHFPFGKGSGDRIQRDFGLPNLIKFPILAELSEAGDGGSPLVVSDPTCSTSREFMELGAAVVREIAKLNGKGKARAAQAYYDEPQNAIAITLLDGEEFLLHPALVRRNDTSALSINEWTGQRTLRDEDIPETIKPLVVNPLGNYAIQITWEDGFNQVAAFELLDSLRALAIPRKAVPQVVANLGGVQATAELL